MMRVGSRVIVKRSDSRGEQAECYGVIVKTFAKDSVSPRGFHVRVGDEELWYPEKHVKPRKKGKF